MSKVLMLIADGMGDWPNDSLNGKTPLEAADTPNMDSLASRSKVGICQTIPESMPPGSDIANMSLLGYDPAVYHTGRGPIEAAAQGLEADSNDLIWRCNLVSLTSLDIGGKMIDYSGGHITTDAAKIIIDALKKELDDEEFTFHTGVQYRHLLIQKNGINSPSQEICINPPHDILDEIIDKDLVRYQAYPPLWNLVQKAEKIISKLNSTPGVNSIWPWGQGQPLQLPAFHDKFGLNGAVISAVDLIKGLGRATGLKVIDITGATGLLDTNYQGKAKAAMDFLEKGDFVFVHLEGPDECGHMGSIEDKTEAIARFDRLIVGPLLEHLKGEQFKVLICCDHLTPVKIRTHSSDPVPFLIYDSFKEETGTEAFAEKYA
ncbi:MAG: cofactor-independent phosphoglycerate mutase, partial [Desulfonatronovibrio sp.]